MAEYFGIRNENEFYFAHYLNSLMDDELKDVCQAEDMKTAFEKISKLGPEYHAVAEARDVVRRRRAAAYAEDRRDYFDKLHAFIGNLAGILGYSGTFTSPGIRLFQGMNLTIPVSGILADKDGSVSTLLIESYYDYSSSMRSRDEGILGNFLAEEQLSVDGIPEASLRELSERIRGTRAKSEMPTWENLLSTQIFAAPNAPRFVVVFGEDSILLADKTKWAERRTLIFDLDAIFERGEKATFRAMVCLLAKSSLSPNGSTPLPDKLDENSHKNAFGVSKSLRYAMREAIEALGNAILETNPSARRQTAAGTANNFSAAALSKECIIVMYRFLFVLFLESRRDLGYFETVKGGEDIFWSAYGLDHLRDLETVPLLTDADRSGLYFDATIKQLFNKIWMGSGLDNHIVDVAGMDAFRVQPLKAHLFDPERTPFFNGAKIPNEVWQKIVYSLSIGESGTGRRKRKGRISYAQLGIQQLGAVYEALLSYTGFHAREDLYEVTSAGVTSAQGSDGGDGSSDDDGVNEDGDAGLTASEDSASGRGGDIFDTGYFVTASDLKGYTNAEKVANPDGTLVCHKKGSFIYRMAGRDRERSASYYTPEILTRCLVRLAIKERVTDDMPADEVMKLTVCEPAMGSAAFLNETIDQLADIYLRKKQTELKQIIPIERYAAEKARVKMVIADNNVFGVDLNPTAADLAEVSLWLGSIGGEKLPTGQSNDKPYIPWFGTQLKCGNSIIGCRREVVFRDGTHKKLGYSEEFPTGAVWHFLLPDEGMAPKLDKVVKGIVGATVDDSFKKWKKEFQLPDKKKNAAEYDKTWKRLHTVSEAINKLWISAADDIKSLNDRTRDDVAYFGHTPKQMMVQDIKSKDRQLYTEISRDEFGNIDYTKSLDSVSDYFRLKTIFDLWCSLWFWPLDKADKLPSWSDFETLVGLLARNEFEAPGQMKFDFLGDVVMTTEGVALANQFRADPTLANLYKLFPCTQVSEAVSTRQHFLHWELEFGPVFKERGGFDLIVGNPPWVKLQWNEQGILSEYDPHIAVRTVSASNTANLRETIFRDKIDSKPAYLLEFSETTGTKAFLSSAANYPSLVGVQTNLFKYFLPLAFRIASNAGVSAFVHPEGVYDDPHGGSLREIMYPRLRLHAQFRNELMLFEDIGHPILYGLNVYGPSKPEVDFLSISKLYHPRTLMDSLNLNNNHADLPLERTTDGKWNLTGHSGRVVHVNENTLKLFSLLYDEPGTQTLQSRLPSIYTNRFLSPILEIFSSFPKKFGNCKYGVSECWHETDAQKIGTTQRKTGVALSVGHMILSGPNFFVANPCFQSPRPNCSSKGDYELIDLTSASPGYRPRTNYQPACDDATYVNRTPMWNNSAINGKWRIVCRGYVNVSSTAERSLMPILVPKGVLHINTVVEYVVDTLAFAVDTAGAWSSLPFDWFFRTMNKPRYLNNVACLMPVICGNNMIRSRTLLLNSVTQDYVDIWNDGWNDAYRKDGWLSRDPCLTKWSDHLSSGKDWKRGTPFRTQLDRRQALLELDVIVTKALGLSLNDLLLMYRVSFPTMRKYDADTYYDQNGRCVYSAKKGEAYLSTQEWESIRDMQEGEFRKTIKETVFSDEPTERTIVYKAPFFRKDREADYREAWEMLEKRG